MVHFRLLLLLFIGPILNIIVISLFLEVDQIFTFGDAGFGGLTLGIDLKSELRWGRESPECFSTTISYEKMDSALTTFHICRWLDLNYDPIESLDFGEAMLSVAFSEHGYIRMGVWNRTVDLFLEQRGEL